jgi:hypothetical protein
MFYLTVSKESKKSKNKKIKEQLTVGARCMKNWLNRKRE